MCGLAGLLSLRGDRVDDSVIGPIIDALAHRGPDGGSMSSLGPLALGHRRLIILDRSSDGDQPMTSADGRYTLVHNGEIYNFLEIADELRGLGHTFRTKTDTEVIIAAYAEWGPEAVSRFNGIWAFALWDRDEERLFLSRDRLGVKPLFLAEGDGHLAFASEIKALLTLPWVSREPELAIVRDFLLDGRVEHGERTFFQGVRRLPAAHNLTVQGGYLHTERYWSPPEPPDDAAAAGSPDDAELVARVRDTVIASVSLQLRSDVPVGSCLSGGLDSSTIVAVASALRSGRLASAENRHHERDNHPQLAFFADFPDPAIAERPYVDAVVRRTGVDLRAVSPSDDQALASLQGVVDAQDEPFGSTSIVAQYHVMQVARDSGVTVLLDGQGADELFGGYRSYWAHRVAGQLGTSGGLAALAGLFARHAPGEFARVGWSLATRGGLAPATLRSARRLRPWLTPAVAAADGQEPVPTWRDGTPLARVLVRDVVWGGLPALLRYEDRNSMAFGIEARVPFLDHRLVELALSLPDRLRIADGEQKVALRRAFTDVVPAEVLDRRDKIGFASPEERWLSTWRPRLTALADRPRAEALGLARAGAVAGALAAWDRRTLATDALWRLLSLEMWARSTVGGEPLPF